MAIDHRIALGVRTADAGQSMSRGLQNAAGFERLKDIKTGREADKLMGLAMSGDKGALEQLQMLSPQRAVQTRKTLADLNESERKSALESAVMDGAKALHFLGQDDKQGFMGLLDDRLARLEASGRDPSHTLQLKQLAQNGEWGQVRNLLQADQEAYQAAGYSKTLRGTSEREFDTLTAGLTEEDRERARRIELGLDPRAVGSSTITIARDGLTDQVAASEAEITGAKEGAKLNQQLALKPKIEAAVTTAKKEAEANAETFTSFKRAKAAMPGLLEVVDKLTELSNIATYTTAGRLFDTAVKELGFGSTEGGTARSTMTAIVDNQVLPLLRETFGAAFTKAEGDSLRATLLDVDATPAAKKATLDAFIQQKYRNIEAQQQELGGNASPGGAAAPGVGEGMTATNPQTGEKIIFRGGQWQAM